MSTCIVEDYASASDVSKRGVERILAGIVMGVVAAVQNGEYSLENAKQDLFVEANITAAKKAGLGLDLIAVLTRTIKLSEIAAIAPQDLNNSLQEVRDLAEGILDQE